MTEPTIVSELIRRLTMGLLMLVHIQFAAFLIGIFGLAVTMELFGVLNSRHPFFDRLAHGLARASVLLYSTGAVLAIIFILVISLFWPTFWYILIRVNIWPMVLEGITFVLTVLYLFPWYYTWNSMARFKAAHVSMGLALVVVVQLQQSMIDVVAGYMLTPTPPQDFLRVFFNPTAIPLDMHRIVGDISFAGFVVAGYAGFRALRNVDTVRGAYFEWMGHIGLIAGLGFMFIQPAIGLAYLEEIRANAPGAFTTMMRGRLSWTFLVQALFLSLLFFLSVLYMHVQVRRRGEKGDWRLRWLLIIVGLSGLLLIQPYVIGPSQDYPWINWVNPIGTMQPWKYFAMAGISLGSIGALLIYLGHSRRGFRWGDIGPRGRAAQYTLVSLALISSLMMLIMGYIRESGRDPYLIYYERHLVDPERYPPLPPPTPSVPQPASAPVGPVIGGGAATPVAGEALP